MDSAGYSIAANLRAPPTARTARHLRLTRDDAGRLAARASRRVVHIRGERNDRRALSSWRVDFDHLDARARSNETWTCTRDLQRLVEAPRRDDHVATDELLDLDERPIRHRVGQRGAARAEAAAEVGQILPELLPPLVKFRIQRL